MGIMRHPDGTKIILLQIGEDSMGMLSYS